MKEEAREGIIHCSKREKVRERVECLFDMQVCRENKRKMKDI